MRTLKLEDRFLDSSTSFSSSSSSSSFCCDCCSLYNSRNRRRWRVDIVGVGIFYSSIKRMKLWLRHCTEKKFGFSQRSTSKSSEKSKEKAFRKDQTHALFQVKSILRVSQNNFKKEKKCKDRTLLFVRRPERGEGSNFILGEDEDESDES